MIVLLLVALLKLSSTTSHAASSSSASAPGQPASAQNFAQSAIQKAKDAAIDYSTSPVLEERLVWLNYNAGYGPAGGGNAIGFYRSRPEASDSDRAHDVWWPYDDENISNGQGLGTDLDDGQPFDDKGNRPIYYSYFQGRLDRLYDQLWLPASRIPLSKIYPEHIALAFKIALNAVRIGECYWSARQNGDNFSHQLEKAGGDYLHDALSTLNTFSFGASGALDKIVGPLIQGAIRADDQAIVSLPPESIGYLNEVFQPAAGSAVYVAYDGRQFVVRDAFLGNIWTGEFRIPFKCAELACQGDLKTRINATARALRALDLLACQWSPAAADSPGTYSYHNPLFGEVKGSIFPPTAEDTARPRALSVGAANALRALQPPAPLSLAAGRAIPPPAPVTLSVAAGRAGLATLTAPAPTVAIPPPPVPFTTPLAPKPTLAYRTPSIFPVRKL